MPETFWKEVIKPESYWPRGADGNPFKVNVSEGRIQHWADTVKAVVDAGNRIPVPYAHTHDAEPLSVGAVSNKPYDNAAHVIDAKVEDDGGLHLLFEPCTEADEANFNTKIKDVSIRTKDWVDGKGKQFKDAITHVAACFHPIVNNQKPFVPASGLALSLSLADDFQAETGNPNENQNSNSLESAKELLAELGIELGDDCTPENFMDRLITAARAVKAFKEKEGGGDEFDNRERPEGAKTQKPAPIAMSADLTDFTLRTVAESPNNPATEKPWTRKELEAGFEAFQKSQPTLEMSADDKLAVENLQLNNKAIIRDRLTAVVKGARMRKQEAEDVLELVNNTELKFSAGVVDEEAHPGIFIPLRMAENAPAGGILNGMTKDDLKHTKKNLKLALDIEEHPEDFYGPDSDLDEAQAKKIADRLVGAS